MGDNLAVTMQGTDGYEERSFTGIVLPGRKAFRRSGRGPGKEVAQQ